MKKVELVQSWKRRGPCCQARRKHRSLNNAPSNRLVNILSANTTLSNFQALPIARPRLITFRVLKRNYLGSHPHSFLLPGALLPSLPFPPYPEESGKTEENRVGKYRECKTIGFAIIRLFCTVGKFVMSFPNSSTIVGDIVLQWNNYGHLWRGDLRYIVRSVYAVRTTGNRVINRGLKAKRVYWKRLGRFEES